MEDTKIWKDLESISDIFRWRYLEPTWNKYQNLKKSRIEALKFFLEFFAYARQGVPQSYSKTAIKIVGKLDDGELLNSETIKKIWDDFKSEVGIKPNPMVNPLCPKGTTYERKNKEKETINKSVIEFIQMDELKNYDNNIIKYIGKELKNTGPDNAQERYQKIHMKLCEINGISDKIASFVLRDISIQYDVELKDIPRGARIYLQPIDIWLRRAVDVFNGGKLSDKNKKYQEFIVDRCLKSDVSPEKVNQGTWYLGSQVAGTVGRFEEILSSGRLLEETTEHLKEEIEDKRKELEILNKIIEKWNQ